MRHGLRISVFREFLICLLAVLLALWAPAALAMPELEDDKLTASDDATSGGDFGASVAIDGNTIVVGAPNDDTVAPNAGAAYAFGVVGRGALCTEGGKLLPSDAPASGASASGAFGSSVDVSGTTALIGARENDQFGEDAEAAFLSLAVPATNTPTGLDVAVQTEDPATGGTPATVTFDNVDSSGVTSLTIGDEGPQPPSGFGLGDPPTYYDIETTAVFTGSVEVCINYGGTSQDTNDAAEDALQLLHFVDGMWEDATTSLDTAGNVICGVVASLSPFGVVGLLNEPPVADAAGARLDATQTVASVRNAG